MRAVILTGQFRSGGSAVAEVLNELGVPMGVKFLAPIPPVLRMEWEDVALFERLMEGTVDRRWMADYWRERVARAKHIVPGVEAVGVKSPFLTFHMDAALAGARDAGLYPVVLRTHRGPPAVSKSFREKLLAFLPEAQRAPWIAWQRAIADAPAKADLVVNYDDMIERPFVWARRISEAVFGRWVDGISAAASKVKEPTTEVAWEH